MIKRIKRNILIMFFLSASANIFAIDLDSGLIGHFPFNGNANDATGLNDSVKVYGAELTYDLCGDVNSAYYFDGEEDYIDLGYRNEYNFSGSITLNAWVNVEDDIENGAKIISKWKTIDGHSGSWALTRKFFNVSANGSQSLFTTFENDIFHEWVMITGIYNIENNKISYYVNCELKDEIDGPDSINLNESSIYIGAAGSTNSSVDLFFKGSIDDIRIYNRAITQEEVCALYEKKSFYASIEGDTVLCGNTPLELKIKYFNEDNNYLWSTGETTESIFVDEPGEYYLEGQSGNGCTDYDTIRIVKNDVHDYEIDYISAYCGENKATLFTTEKFSDYLWSTGDTTETTEVDKGETYTVFVTDEFGCTSTREISLETDKKLQYYINDNNYGSVCLFERVIKDIKLQNLYKEQDIEISNYYFKNNNAFFPHIDSLPLKISKNNISTQTVAYHPFNSGNFVDTLIIEVTKPCYDRIEVPVSGSTLPTDAHLWVNDTLLAPQNNVCLPVYGNFDCDFINGAVVDYQIEVTYDNRVFDAVYLERGDIINKWNDDHTTHIVISDNNVFINKEPIEVNKICGTVFASSVNTSPIIFNSIAWGNSNILTEHNNGKLNIKICELDFAGFEFVKIPDIILYPNPAKEKVTCRIYFPSQQESSLEIINNLGQVEKRLFFYEGENKMDVFETEIDLQYFSSGVYNVKYTSPEKVLTTQLIINK